MLKDLARSVLRRHGLALSREPDVALFLQKRDVDLVLDVGANVGQYAGRLRRDGYSGSIASFEPIKSVFEVASAASAGDPNWSVTNMALGSRPGELVMNVAANTVYSSAKRTTAAAGQFDPKSAVVRTETVPMSTVDDFLRDRVERNVFLKIDTQGFEREVLEGARASLGAVTGLHLELPVARFYEGVWSFSEAIRYCETIGFVPAQFRSVHPGPGDRGAAVEFDCVLRRAD